MSKGIIYVMTTIVPGLIKIGKTGSQNFESRMYNLEHDGYRNVTGLKRCFAIEVNEYDEKEALLHSIFSKSRVEDTELFALDVNLVKQLLVSFDGTQVYPKNESKEQVFEESKEKRGIALIPDGTYYLKRKIKVWDNACTATLVVKDGLFTVKKGARICPFTRGGWDVCGAAQAAMNTARIENDTLLEDVSFKSPSAASDFVTHGSSNGWMEWKTPDGKPLDIYR